MSAHYGYFKIGVYKKDGTPDAAKAKEVFDWIKTNCKWFNGSDGDEPDAFVLEGHKITNNDDAAPDGLDVKYNDDPFGDGVPNNLKFLPDAYDAVKPEQIVASFYYDGSETSWDENFFTLSIWEDGNRRDIYDNEQFDRTEEDDYDIPEFVYTDIDKIAKGKKPPVVRVEDGVVVECLKSATSVTIPEGVTENRRGCVL